MRVLLFLLMVVSTTGCYPKFNLREPVYIVPGNTYRWPCEARGQLEICRNTIIEAAKMWFDHLPSERQPKIVVTFEPPKKTVNEVVYLEVNPTLDHPAHLKWWPRPLVIVIRTIMHGPVGAFPIGHELGHVFIGPRHERTPSIMTESSDGTLRPNSGDIKRLCKKHPELKCRGR